jgi:quinol monooxygenase YgiN
MVGWEAVMRLRWLLAWWLCFAVVEASAQAPVDPSPHYVVSYLEQRPNAQSEGAAMLKSWEDAQRRAPGNLRAELIRRPTRPGQFVMIGAWRDKAAFDAAASVTQELREKVHALRNSPEDDRLHSAFSAGKLDTPRGALYVVTHVDVVPPRREDAQAALKVLAEANRAAEGNLRFEVLQQTNRLNHFTLVEIWRSRQAFDANSMSPHQREFRDKLAQMAGALYDERLYESLD